MSTPTSSTSSSPSSRLSSPQASAERSEFTVGGAGYKEATVISPFPSPSLFLSLSFSLSPSLSLSLWQVVRVLGLLGALDPYKHKQQQRNIPPSKMGTPHSKPMDKTTLGQTSGEGGRERESGRGGRVGGREEEGGGEGGLEGGRKREGGEWKGRGGGENDMQ